ncbi:MAG TPA: PIN domain-containing protein [Frankiaceae bacterium]|nr:PIN domain-containing protein [Frankiaceae bacterium]
MPVLLDSTVLIDAARGRPAADRIRGLLGQGEVPYICAINTEEIHRGLRLDEVGRVTTLLLAFRLAPLGLVEGALAGTWRREYAARGITLDRADCLIAAAALGVHATIATGNPKDFPMEGVTVEHWPVGR